MNLGGSATHPDTSVARAAKRVSSVLTVSRLPGGLALSPAPRLSCGCKVVGPFSINRIINIPVIYPGTFVMFGSGVSVKLTSVH